MRVLQHGSKYFPASSTFRYLRLFSITNTQSSTPPPSCPYSAIHPCRHKYILSVLAQEREERIRESCSGEHRNRTEDEGEFEKPMGKECTWRLAGGFCMSVGQRVCEGKSEKYLTGACLCYIIPRPILRPFAWKKVETWCNEHIRGISESLILKKIMERFQYQQNLEAVPLSCDYFDLMGGTSTGGFVHPTKLNCASCSSCYQGLSLLGGSGCLSTMLSSSMIL
jgi:hypothetical protein